jgi:outer membrane protein assembly factor BamD (BamD/ComL family)
VYAFALLLALATLGVGIYRLARDGGTDWTMLAAGALALVAVAVTWPIAAALGSRAGPAGGAAADGAWTAKLDQLATALNRISDQQLLSDRAKHIAYRDKERDALRRAIQEDIARKDWDGAMKLADDIEREFGYKAEADRLRAEIRVKCDECARRELDEGLAAVDKHTRAEQWNNALREAETMLAKFPDNERVRNLPQEIETRRQGHKRQLLESWHEAVARHDVDGSIEILKQLDTYLTPKEAEALQETARGIFREKLNSLGKQFAVSVQEHRWHDALGVGDQIVRDFPNTRIAQEVREKMDVLRKRATEPAHAAT